MTLTQLTTQIESSAYQCEFLLRHYSNYALLNLSIEIRRVALLILLSWLNYSLFCLLLQVLFECGHQNVLRSVEEVEKCHYVFNMQGPTFCNTDALLGKFYAPNNCRQTAPPPPTATCRTNALLHRPQHAPP